MPEGMKVDYATIHRAAQDCEDTTKQLQGQFDQLKQDLNPLTHDWTGDAKTQYLHAQTQWDQKFEDLKQVLAKIAIALPQVADGYQSTDKGVQDLF
ncbi:WXG100 family type VII secretion target [Amycolatopsis sp. H20-H5]|uniref:WXG100 family type VII secretion target n=1 Tax=Amycolatopsis sp. H20-H5 TaxID=3046309 RepID=UPI002DBD3EE5|nr:WXG100 family type VII secretion target [Amycolatopsis sp. H20-H5]MEC3980223.1 WXG100 family type VII secretion target [Amycolatopsis sp. H20-H5]